MNIYKRIQKATTVAELQEIKDASIEKAEDLKQDIADLRASITNRQESLANKIRKLEELGSIPGIKKALLAKLGEFHAAELEN